MTPRRSTDPRFSWRSVAIGLGLLAVWEAAVRSGFYSGLFLPAPTAILSVLARELANGRLATNLLATLSRLVGGLAIGSGAGLLLGLSMGWSRRLRSALNPVIAGIHPIPKIALFPLLIVWLGVGEQSKVVAVAVGAFFPMLLNTMAGVMNINPVHLDIARNSGARTGQLFRRVLFPGSLPMVLTGLRVSANVAFLSTIGVEMVAAKTGLGSMLWLSWQLFRIDQLYATLVIIAVIGVCLTSLIRWLGERAAPWLVPNPVTV